MTTESIVKLDEEFKNGLNDIKSFVNRLKLPAEPKLCLLWIEKLQNATVERELRNQFLKSLITQVESGQLSPPFVFPPPSNAPLSSINVELGSGEEVDSEMSVSSRSDDSNAFETENKTNLIAELSRLKRISQLQVQNSNLTSLVKHYKSAFLANESTLKSLSEDVLSIKLKLEESSLKTGNAHFSVNFAELKDSLCEIIFKLDESTQRIASLETSFSRFQNQFHETVSETRVNQNECHEVIRSVQNEIQEQKVRHKQEIKVLKKLLTCKDHQLARIGSCVEKQCTKMEEKVSCIKKEIDHHQTPKIINISEISDIKKHVISIENTNKKLVSALENRLSRLKNDYENKIQALELELQAKSEASSKMEDVIAKMEANFSKLVEDLKESSEKRRKFDSEKINELRRLLDQKNEDNFLK